MTTTTAEVRKTARVTLTPPAAFELFTEGIGEWWPLASHSVGRDDATSVACEPRVGGRIIETLGTGEIAVWGTIVAWEPARRVRFTWHPGTPEAEATDVEVSFRPDPGTGGTVVELVHTGWDRRPDGGAARAGYDAGWVLVLGRYAVAGGGDAGGDGGGDGGDGVRGVS